jgi:Na+/H+ antiporter NhaD/arsenite permease-like protein
VGTIYALAIGVNYGAFALPFSASLAGLLWRKGLAENGTRVGRLEFVRVNLPLIVFYMVVSCAVLVGEVYIVRNSSPHFIRS